MKKFIEFKIFLMILSISIPIFVTLKFISLPENMVKIAFDTTFLTLLYSFIFLLIIAFSYKDKEDYKVKKLTIFHIVAFIAGHGLYSAFSVLIKKRDIYLPTIIALFISIVVISILLKIFNQKNIPNNLSDKLS